MANEFIKWAPLLLDALRALGGSAEPRETYDWIAEKANLSPEERWKLNPSGPVRFQNQVQFARQYLVWEGLIDGSRHGIWTLTPEGAKTHLTEEQSQQLVRKWSKIHRKQKPVRPAENQTEPQETEASELPEEVEEQNLLMVIHSLPPDGFERLCKRLLHECGFERVEVLGRSHDGGIDGQGILRLNPFVKLKVVFQCKRYKEAVGRAPVGEFRNAMLGRAEKGVFITTGYFTSEAEKEANREGVPPIELVDGERLVELFKSKLLGVHRRETFEVDQTFFDQFR
jgi:restriction system protein